MRSPTCLFVYIGLLSVFIQQSCLPSSSEKKAQAPDIWTGDQVKIIGIIKGDELEVTKAGKKARLRLLGVQAFAGTNLDAPLTEIVHRTSEWLTQRLLNQEAKIVLEDATKDTYGRYLGYLEKDGTDMNRALIEEGLVIAYTEFPFAREADYLAAEKKARDDKRLLWNQQGLTTIAQGLRRQWADARRGRNQAPAADPLLP